MRVSEAKELIKKLVETFFDKATVTFAKQSRAPKHNLPLIVITPGDVKRDANPTYKILDGYLIGSYASRMSVMIDLFTHGSPVYDDETAHAIAYENTALDDMLSFADFLGSPYVIEWSTQNNITVLIEGNVRDLSAVVKDSNYEYRSCLTIMLYFTQTTVGSSAALSEDSVVYPTENTDSEGMIIYTPKEPVPEESISGIYNGIEDPDNIIYGQEEIEEIEKKKPIVKPEKIETSVGGCSDALVDTEIGYFIEAEIKEE